MLEALHHTRVFDLSQPYFAGMPHFPTHPPFLFGLTKLHGDTMLPGGGSSAADALALGGHTGTHIDALCHFSCGGKLFGGGEVADVQAHGGIREHDAASIDPIVRRGVLLDIAGQQRTGSLAPDFVITPAHLEDACAAQGVVIEAGDVVLLRTGWAEKFHDARLYLPDGSSPGPELAGAYWLSRRRVFATGSDTLTFERVPNPSMPVHVHLLVDSGIHIIENLNLDELARERVWTFLFVGAPLKIRGGTGAPMRPLALI